MCMQFQAYCLQSAYKRKSRIVLSVVVIQWEWEQNIILHWSKKRWNSCETLLIINFDIKPMRSKLVLGFPFSHTWLDSRLKLNHEATVPGSANILYRGNLKYSGKKARKVFIFIMIGDYKTDKLTYTRLKLNNKHAEEVIN